MNAFVDEIAYPIFKENVAPSIVEVVTILPLSPRYSDCSGVQVQVGFVIAPNVTVCPELFKTPRILSTCVDCNAEARIVSPFAFNATILYELALLLVKTTFKDSDVPPPVLAWSYAACANVVALLAVVLARVSTPAAPPVLA